MRKGIKYFSGFVTMGLIVILSTFAMHSANKPSKLIIFKEIDWDI